MAHPRHDESEQRPQDDPEPQHGSQPQDRTTADLTIVIPVKDDPGGVGDTLDRLEETSGSDGGLPPVIVVDDGSSVPLEVDHPAVAVVRNEAPTGPGRARQRGLFSVDTSMVAFIDAGVLIGLDDLEVLLEEFRDRAVKAVAPRIRSRPRPHLVGRYEQRRSPLDLGPRRSLVGPGRQVPYVPTACLMARVEAIEDCGGFDPDLRYGEDVDMVWRLGAVGSVRYCPHVEATHPPRASLKQMARQRRSYGSAAAPLAVRHGNAVAPAKLSGWSLLISLLAAAGHPFKAALLGGWTALALRPKIEPLPDVTVEAALLTGRGHWYGGLSLLTALSRTWIPLVALAALLFPSQRRRLTGLMAASLGRRLLDGPRSVGPAVCDVAVGAIDDLSYCAGVWQGVARTRSTAALLPEITSWPRPDPTRPDRTG